MSITVTDPIIEAMGAVEVTSEDGVSGCTLNQFIGADLLQDVLRVALETAGKTPGEIELFSPTLYRAAYGGNRG
jgi:hypothetical protein